MFQNLGQYKRHTKLDFKELEISLIVMEFWEFAHKDMVEVLGPMRKLEQSLEIQKQHKFHLFQLIDLSRSPTRLLIGYLRHEYMMTIQINLKSLNTIVRRTEPKKQLNNYTKIQTDNPKKAQTRFS